MTESGRPFAAGRGAGRSLSVILAVGRKKLADAHFQYASELIQRAEGEVSAPQALTIYARLHHLAELELRSLKNRMMVLFSREANTDTAHLPNTFVSINGEVEWDVTASLLTRIRKRLGGRRNLELRRWVELHTGRAECGLLRLHVDNVLAVRESIGTEGEVADVVRLYMSSLGIRESLYEALYNASLDRLFDELAASGDAAPDVPADVTGLRARRRNRANGGLPRPSGDRPAARDRTAGGPGIPLEPGAATA